VSPQRRSLRLFGSFVALVAPLVAIAVLVPATAASAEPSVEQLNRKIKSESARLERVVEQFNKTTEELKANVAAEQRLSAEIGPLTAELDAATARLGELAAAAYKGGALTQMSAVLAAGSPMLVVDRLTTLDQLNKYQHAQIDRVTDLRTRHDARARELDKLISDGKAKRAALADQKKKINADLDRLYELRRQAYGRARAAASHSRGAPPYVAGKAGKAVRYAYGALGTPYVWAGESGSGYDCSGLTKAAWAAAGVSLPHNAAMQYNALPHIGRGSLRPGDLVFYSGLGHVAIYVGGGRVIHAPTFGEVVQLASVDMMTPYGYARPG
jgi:cell wall-associated NlpC family hydrolase